MNEQQLIDKLKAIERLFAGAATPGERAAAAGALDRIRRRLDDLVDADPPIEFKFSLSDGWSRRLFIALLRRYGLRPYRYHRQRHTTVMARVPKQFVDEILWPEYLKLQESLQAYLSDITERVIKESVFRDATEADVVEEPARALGEGHASMDGRS